jgi:hypothetical protein
MHGLFLSTLFHTICEFYDTTKPANVFWGNTAYVKFTVDDRRDPVFKIEKIESTNVSSHLTAVQWQKGGVGSSRYDEVQKTMKDFFAPSQTNSKQTQASSPVFVMLPSFLMIRIYRPVLRISCGT